VPSGEVLGSFISQFYDTRPPPRLILLSEEIPECPLVAEALSIKADRKVEIAVPTRGEKREVVDAAVLNARAQLERQQAENATQRALLEGVAETFTLDAPPKRIEVYDNSHVQGANAVGAMIVAGPEGLQKTEYRKFNIKSEDLTPGDDTAMMREVLMRRFGRLMRENADGAGNGKWSKWPDLVLIDGGAAQVEAAHAALAEVGIDDVVVVGVAKSIEREAGREHFYRRGQPPFRLESKSAVLYYLQRLRDEAHRFAIGSHRARRRKDIRESGLQEIPGVGPARKRALLQHFGTLKAIERASPADLTKVEGVSAEMAKKIYDFFHERAG
jgi:excinuclease ABC subunit C